MVNKDYLRQILSEEKVMLPLTEVKFVNVPMYDELSVKNLWPSCKGNAQLMKYFPDKLPKGRLPDRKYFFDILNTVKPDYVDKLIKHA